MRYSTDVRVRWSDLDAFGHVNNARTVTLLEEARIDWLFRDASARGVDRLTEGIVVAQLEIGYRRPLGFLTSVAVSMWVRALSAARVTIGYEAAQDGQLAVTASTVLVPVDPESFRPRRFRADELDYLAEYQHA